MLEIIAIIILFGAIYVLNKLFFEYRRKARQTYYRDVYLKSEDWQRKRYVVLKRDNWKCVFCGEPATQVHHKRYARINIGKEPISWLVSVCHACHAKLQGHPVIPVTKPPVRHTIIASDTDWKYNTPALHDWLRANPTKGINDYYKVFGK